MKDVKECFSVVNTFIGGESQASLPGALIICPSELAFYAGLGD